MTDWEDQWFKGTLKAEKNSVSVVELEHRFHAIWRPEGDWRQLGRQFTIAGLWYRGKSAKFFLYKALKSYQKDLPHGLRIEAEPTNKKDKHALKVMGYWTTKSFIFGEREYQKFIGYVPAGIALQYAYYSGKTASSKHLEGLPPIPVALDFQYGKIKGKYIDIYANIIYPGKRGGFWRNREAPF